MNLNSIGLNHYLSQIKKSKLALPKQSGSLARIFSEHKTGWDLISEQGPIKGILMSSVRKKTAIDDLPKVGDWVVFEKIPTENKAKIIQILPRYTKLVRHIEKKRINQTIATNIDQMFIVLSTDQIFNPSQLNRYLAIALEGKIDPIVIINKIDKQTDSSTNAKLITKEIKSIHPNQKIILSSAITKTGLIELDKYIKAGYTGVLVGNSGVGKSSLVNALLEEANQLTNEVSELGKGRHTTTSRKIFVLPSNGIIIDTPGMRTLEFDSTKESSTEIFSNLNSISKNCTYRNCDHIKSAGCALQTALSKKIITVKQLEQFLALSGKHEQKVSYNKSRN